MILLDWRGASPDVVAPVFAQERERWIAALHWDPSRALDEVEQARTTWGLPGFVALDEGGRALGSIFYLPDGNRYDIGGVTSETAAVTAALLDGVVARATSESVDEVRCFVFENAASLGDALAARGFGLERYLYLATPLEAIRAADTASIGTGSSHPEAGAASQAWRPGDVPAVAALLQQAYDREAGRIFAPEGTLAEWDRYLRNLVEHGACGDLHTHASRVLWSHDEVLAAAVVTRVAPHTAHLAQFAVHPKAQGKGVARAVLHDAFVQAAQDGCSTATLLVAEGNTRARALYASIGFRQIAAFVAASRVTSRAA